MKAAAIFNLQISKEIPVRTHARTGKVLNGNADTIFANIIAEVSRDAMKAKLNAVLTLSTAKETAEGIVWYANAAVLAESYESQGIMRDTAAGIISALSPQTSWKVNVKCFHDLIKTGDCGWIEANKERAKKIMEGAQPLDVLNGPKTRSFYRNIVEPLAWYPVTVDTHALAVLLGRSATAEEKKILEHDEYYTFFADVYREVAAEKGMIPNQVQSIAWVTWRRLKGIKNLD
jgi:hypothetical protein